MGKRKLRTVGVAVLGIAMLFGGVHLSALDTEIGETGLSLNGERQHVRTQETNLGNLVTDVIRYYTEADIAIYNGGGIRDSASMGAITLETAMEIMAFENNVVTLEMTGAEVLETLERGVSYYPEVSGAFLQVSGIRLYFNPENPDGERIERVYVAGSELDPNATYTLATNDFLAAGGDDYSVLGDATQIAEHEMIDTQMFIEYIQQNSPLFPTVEGRIVVLR